MGVIWGLQIIPYSSMKKYEKHKKMKKYEKLQIWSAFVKTDQGK